MHATCMQTGVNRIVVEFVGNRGGGRGAWLQSLEPHSKVTSCLRRLRDVEFRFWHSHGSRGKVGGGRSINV